jgi:hypothetical protein
MSFALTENREDLHHEEDHDHGSWHMAHNPSNVIQLSLESLVVLSYLSKFRL